MKPFSIILAIYLLCLSLLPCSDKPNNAMKEELKISALAQESQHEHQETDTCTPFCSCACCATSVSFQPLTILLFSKITFETNYLLFDVIFVSHENKNIWQPPQLA